MEVYVLDKDLSIIAVLDKYNSFIWTERYAEAGDFELKAPASLKYVEILQQDRYLKIKDSNELMIIESVAITTENRAQHMTVTGRSLVSILDRRVVLGARYFNDGEIDGAVLNQNIWQIIRTIVYENVTNADQNPISDLHSEQHLILYNSKFKNNRKISQIKMPGVDFYQNNLNENPYGKITSTNPPSVQFNGESIYDAVKSICDRYHLGFKIIYDPSTPSTPFYFYIYDGQNRIYNDQPAKSDGHSYNNSVMLSPKFDNITNISYGSSKNGFKNIMLAIGDENKTGDNYQCWAIVTSAGEEITNADETKDEYKGLNLRESIQDFSSEVTHDGDNTNDQFEALDDAAYQRVLVNRAIDVLKDQNKALEAFDGELINNERYEVKKDYNLGDLIEMNDNMGHSKWMRVTEIIYSHGSNGYKIYPTLAVYEKDEWHQRN